MIEILHDWFNNTMSMLRQSLIFLFGNLIWWAIISFIVQDMDPTHWWLFKSTFGRIIVVVIEISMLYGVIDLESK